MKYLWEAALEAQKENIPLEYIHFVHSTNSSAYMELALPYLKLIPISGFIPFLRIYFHQIKVNFLTYVKVLQI